jgi:hypothetical protein
MPSLGKLESMRRSVLTLLASLAGTWAIAQYNTAGRIHVAIGAALGGHGTSLEETFKLNVLGVNLTQTRTKTGAAATSTLPFEVGVGLGKVASIGLLIEMGRYVPDTNSTDQRNAVAIVALQPRFYLLNRDRFALSGSLALGGAALHIVDDTPYKKWDGRYSGPATSLRAWNCGPANGMEAR